MASLTPKTLFIGNTSAANVYTANSTSGNYTIVKNIITNTIHDNYKGVYVSLFNSVPGVTINYSTREILSRNVPDNLKIFISLFSTALSIALTHPLDTLSTCITTRTPINIHQIIKYKGFSERFFEKNLTIGSKMILLDMFNNYDKKKNNTIL